VDLGTLRAIGLTDDEVAVLSMVFFDGWGIRRIATRWDCAHTTIQRIKNSGIEKLKAAGVTLKKPKVKLPRERSVQSMDPTEMDERFSTDQKYNARD
jgi:hypothetical protein